MADWKDVIRSVAPALASTFGTPLMGAAVKVLGDTLLGDGKSSEEAIGQAITDGLLTPDAILKLKAQDKEFELQIKQLALQSKQEDDRHEEAYLSDTQDARKNNSQNSDVFLLGVIVLIAYGIILAGSLYGSYAIITGGIILKDVATVGIVSTFIGSIIGSMGAMAGQVISLYFGSSKGSDKKSDQLAEAFKQIK